MKLQKFSLKKVLAVILAFYVGTTIGHRGVKVEAEMKLPHQPPHLIQHFREKTHDLLHKGDELKQKHEQRFKDKHGHNSNSVEAKNSVHIYQIQPGYLTQQLSDVNYNPHPANARPSADPQVGWNPQYGIDPKSKVYPALSVPPVLDGAYNQGPYKATLQPTKIDQKNSAETSGGSPGSVSQNNRYVGSSNPAGSVMQNNQYGLQTASGEVGRYPPNYEDRYDVRPASKEKVAQNNLANLSGGSPVDLNQNNQYNGNVGYKNRGEVGGSFDGHGGAGFGAGLKLGGVPNVAPNRATGDVYASAKAKAGAAVNGQNPPWSQVSADANAFAYQG